LQIPWANISDMMSALMMVFLLISVTYSSQVKNKSEQLEEKNKKIHKITADFSDSRYEIYASLNEAFSHKFEEWHATLDRETLTLRFNNPAILFEPGSDRLTPAFEKILADLWINYIEVLRRYPEDVAEVKIQGHTSSEWSDSTIEESYFNNMKLSQERTRSTLIFCYNLTPMDKRDWVIENVTANGMSFARTIKAPDGSEDVVRSRRVEFTVVVNSHIALEKIGEALDD
jgi:outer membrane protein OmpA-like peptidoglycan-associated protein